MTRATVKQPKIHSKWLDVCQSQYALWDAKQCIQKQLRFNYINIHFWRQYESTLSQKQQVSAIRIMNNCCFAIHVRYLYFKKLPLTNVTSATIFFPIINQMKHSHKYFLFGQNYMVQRFFFSYNNLRNFSLN